MSHTPFHVLVGYVKMGKDDVRFMMKHPKKFTKEQLQEERQHLKALQHELREAAVREFVQDRDLRHGRGRTRRHRRHRITRRR